MKLKGPKNITCLNKERGVNPNAYSICTQETKFPDRDSVIE